MPGQTVQLGHFLELVAEQLGLRRILELQPERALGGRTFMTAKVLSRLLHAKRKIRELT